MIKKLLLLFTASLLCIAAGKKLESPKGREQTISLAMATNAAPTPVSVGVPLPPKTMTKSNTNQYPGWVGLSWTYSPSTNATGYYVYQGTNSRAYNVRHDVGMAATNMPWYEVCRCPTNGVQTTGCYRVVNLEVGKKYFFTVTAVASDGQESDYCNEVDFTFRYKTNTTIYVSALIPPSWTVYTNLPPITNASSMGFFRTSYTNNTVAIQSAKTIAGPWTDRLSFTHSNPIWKLGITRTNW